MRVFFNWWVHIRLSQISICIFSISRFQDEILRNIRVDIPTLLGVKYKICYFVQNIIIQLLQGNFVLKHDNLDSYVHHHVKRHDK